MVSSGEGQPSLSALALSVILAVLLQVYPLTGALAHWRPDFLFLVMFYWLRHFPFHLGLGFAWLLGLMGDIAYGDVLGRSALAFCLTAYLLHLLQQRILNYRAFHEIWLLIPLVMVSQTIMLTINVILGRGVVWNAMVLTAFSSALVWPLLKLILAKLLPTRQPGV